MQNEDGQWRRAILCANASISDAIKSLDMSALKIVMILDADGSLKGTISDGDIRRGIIKGLGIESNVSEIMRTDPFVVPSIMSRELVLQLMVANKLQQVPIVGDGGRVLGLHLWDEITVPPNRTNLMVIMAGGLGSRLGAHTKKCPKPLLPVYGRPILEHIIERAKSDGFKRFIISINYLGEMIEEYFGDGKKLGVDVDYLRETAPLGTAGALSLMNAVPSDPIVITNGDVITDINYGEVLDFHNRNLSDATMAIRLHEYQHPFGIVQTNELNLIGFEEKPTIRSHINAGVYVLNPNVLSFLKHDAHCDMPTLYERLIKNKMKVMAFPMHEPWLDIGRPSDLEIANKNIRNI